jgi:hypothetical protein
MQILLFTALAILLYLLADRLLEAIERRAGRRLDQRSLVFLAILLPLALLAFAAVRKFVGVE